MLKLMEQIRYLTELIDDAIARGLEVWPLLAESKHEAAMLRLHTKPQVKSEE